ncbi:hypothetical protein CY35_11G116400 [Sphagnum magellanicum]|nr:hypothetical protein CY35_11G116400 [Sphagnum magellanicum]KAH9548979.1 hypothetical protein CY35_11G116400 [Sphagnum magellanicum]KAH9548980.1 hypothetical protein CY35_11G116400 [Sphagnum magellanicum]
MAAPNGVHQAGGRGGAAAALYAAGRPPVGGLSPLSESLWKARAESTSIAVPSPHDFSARLTWIDLWVTVTGKGSKQAILQGLTGYAEPGEIMAIMGPSGSGKSTLLDTLAGRLAKTASQTGEVLLNGRRKTNLSYGIAAYVTQSDDLIGTLTVNETVYYSASLRLSSKIPRAEKKAIVESTIREMGLMECRNTPVGNWHLRGLSGGERRRLSIALEILTRPRLLFLDEPTSGLDSAAAFFVVSTLRNLARDGRTVIASIHQPSSEVFELFDNLTLLSGGRLVYFGEAKAAREHFAASGFPCPALRSPSDHFLRAINADFDQVKASLQGSFKMKAKDLETADLLNRMPTPQVVRILVEAYQNSEYAMASKLRIQEILQTQGMVLESGGSQAGFFRQSFTLTRRSFVNMSRDIGYYWLRLVIYIVLSICLGTIYWRVGLEFSSILGRAGCIAYVGGFLTFMSIGGFPSFVEDMKVFHRERLNGHYGVLAFVVGNTLSSLPFLFLISLVSSSIVYFMAQLHQGFDHFGYFVLSLFVQVTIVESLMMAVASIVPNFLMGIITGAGIQGIFMLVAGFFRLPKDIPKPLWRYPLSYMGFDMYALQGMYKNDFLGLTFKNFVLDGVAVGPDIPGSYVVEQIYGIQTKRGKWADFWILFGMIFAYRLIFFVCIKLKENLGPMIRSLLTQYRTNKRLARRPSELQNVIRPVTASPSPAPSPLSDCTPLQRSQW